MRNAIVMPPANSDPRPHDATARRLHRKSGRAALCVLCGHEYRTFTRGACRSCYRKWRDCGLPLPATQNRKAQQVRRMREWLSKITIARRDLLRQLLAETLEPTIENGGTR